MTYYVTSAKYSHMSYVSGEIHRRQCCCCTVSNYFLLYTRSNTFVGIPYAD